MYVYLFDELGVLSGPVDPVVPGLGRLIPSNGIELEESLAEPEAGKAWALVDEAPVQLVDHRGTVYDVKTGMEVEWLKLGEVPDEYTSVPYPGPHHAWDGAEWVLDPVAEAERQRNLLMEKANQATIGMADAFIAGILSSADTKTFKAFAAYKLALSKIDQQPGYPTTVDWPVSP